MITEPSGATPSALSAIAATMPTATPEEVKLRWCELHYGKPLTDRLRAFLAARAS